MEFWHDWLCHSNFSFLTGAAHPEEQLRRALALGYDSLGLADFEGLYGAVRPYRELREIRHHQPEAQIRLHYGAEVRWAVEPELPILLQDRTALYAQTLEGYGNLGQLLSHSHRGGKGTAQVSLADFEQFGTQGLIAIQPMRGLIRRGEAEALERRLVRLKELLPGRVFLAVSRHLSPVEDRWIEPTLALAKRLGLPWLPAQDAFFDLPSKKPLCDLLQAIRHNRPLAQVPEQLFPNARRYLHSKRALSKLYGPLPGIGAALRRSHELALSFDFNLNQLRYQYPQEMIPQGLSPQEYLSQQTWKAARKRHPQGIPSGLEKLILKELGLIEQLGFADYFLTVWDIVSWARSKGILCQGRGSAANSAVCYVLGITAIDPDRFDLLFERFISVERGDPPDIDVDFENARREEVIQYIYRRYGRERAAMVCNVVTLRRKGAFRLAAKGLGIPEPLAERASKRLQTLAMRTQEGAAALTQMQAELRQEGQEMPPAHLWPRWADLAEQLRGYPRHLSIHSGGFMLADRPIHQLVPQEPARMEGRTVIQWSKDDLEALNFFKIDILALGMLTAIQKCLEMLKQDYGKPLSLAEIPAEDAATYQMIQQADTIGVFQIESAAQRASLPSLLPDNFFDLVVQVAIIRPGPILGGVKHPYIRRKRGWEQATYPSERLRPILERTHGTIIFQEQLMRVAMEVGGFSPGQADLIRKNIGSFSASGDISKWIGQLVEGMVRAGLPPEFIEEILLQIQGFSSYGFPESHAASFALLAYSSSWLKRHYPAPFFAGLLNSQPMGFYSPDSLIKTARRDGVEVLAISVNHSTWESHLEPRPNNQHRFAIRLGFNLVSDLSEEVVQRLVAERNRGAYSSLEDATGRLRLNRKERSALAAANTFAHCGQTRRPAIWQAERPWEPPAPPPAQLETLPAPTEHEQAVAFAAEDEIEAVRADYRATGLSLGRHLAELIRSEAWVYPLPAEEITPTAQLEQVPSGRMVTIFGQVLVKQSPGTAKKMLFVTLEDEGGTVQTTITPQIYAQYAPVIEGQRFLCLQGLWQDQYGSKGLLVKQVFAPEAPKAAVISLEKRRRFKRLGQAPKKKVRAYM